MIRELLTIRRSTRVVYSDSVEERTQPAVQSGPTATEASLYAQLVESWTQNQTLIAFSGETISKIRQDTHAKISYMGHAVCHLLERVQMLTDEVVWLHTKYVKKTSALSVELDSCLAREQKLVDENTKLAAELISARNALADVRAGNEAAEAIRRLEDELNESKANVTRLTDDNTVLIREMGDVRTAAVQNTCRLKEEVARLLRENAVLAAQKNMLACEKDALIRDIYSMRVEAARSSSTRAEIEEEVLDKVFRHNNWVDGAPVCPVTMEPIKVPAVVGICGHVFESEAINNWWQRYQRCPACNGKTSIRFDLAKPRIESQ